MKTCEKCGVYVAADRRFCPLCQRELSGEAQPGQEEIFPYLPTYYRQYNLFFRILVFLSFAAGAVSLLINFLIPTKIWWSLIEIAGIACMWVILITAVKKRHNITKGVLYQAVVISVAVGAIDYLTGFHHWSVNYVIPTLLLFTMLAIVILARVLHSRPEDYLIYLIVNGVLGLVPLVFLLTGWATVRWPSLCCITVSFLSLVGIFVFSKMDPKAELKKRLHI